MLIPYDLGPSGRKKEKILMATLNPLPSTRHLLTSLISTVASSTQQQDQSEKTSNPLSNTSQNTKSAFLTLHSLFPHDFLPALDLLDRGLVTRFVLTRESEASEQPDAHRSGGGGGDDDDGDNNDNNEARTEHTQDENRFEKHTQPQPNPSLKRRRKQTVAYQVRSAQRTKPSASRSEYPTSTTATTGASYEVRLKAWNCSCPAFAFAALPVDAAENGNMEDGSGGDQNHDVGYGLSGNRSNTSATHHEDDKGAWLGFGGLTRGMDVPVCKHLLACVVAERCQGFEQLVEEKEVGVEEVAGWAAGWGD